ncbi:hypothetical protein PR202_gb26210 [Eleusine coracana subsp. coracana]|uniref:Reverse transcriptase zinc-binding domain-containing protein n=1 Tax=Eleusine coracana subsp. coracana TaxID=191504 RepID=A0AAV5FSN0_ELECO|nr:hypothetical protein PR202_gb26210 [Eleusine coracana subsp. coracana]
MHADRQNAEALKHILNQYCQNSGQQISAAKSSIFFSGNTGVQEKGEVCQILDIMTESLSDKYLGLPALVGADRSDCFKHLIDRVLSKTKGWKEKLLSLGGKEVLIKLIAQAVLVYVMMVFKIPKNICKGMTDAISQFWWGDEVDQKKIHWQAWWKMCFSKDKGGMGFRDPHCFNIAMLSKQVWRLLCEPDSFCARVLRSKYYPDGKLLSATMKKGSSFTWQSVLTGLECFKRGYVWRVGDGKQIHIWNDNWIPTSNNLKIQTPHGNNLVTTVDELIDPITGRWDENLIRDLFWDIDVNRILQIPLIDGREDLVAWHYNRSGLFTVRSAYHCQWKHKFGSNPLPNYTSGAGPRQVWPQLWKLKVPSKIKMFGWRFLNGFIPCRGILANKHIPGSSSCPVCLRGCEDLKHLLFTCSRVREVWTPLGVWERIQRLMNIDRSGAVLMEEVIRLGGTIPNLNDVGIAELILTGGWYIYGGRDVS